ncbi:MAG: hypothetical protein IPN86_20775 [Saprospiraceae bacterium]|nr:hypothetical protein [Saprospiraceae bacterium]
MAICIKSRWTSNSTISQYYQFLDENPQSGTSYYRIKQVDFDGQISYTPIKSISFDVLHTQHSFQISPNPVTHQLSIQGKYSGETQIQIFNAQGRKMDGLLFYKEQERMSVDISHLPCWFISIVCSWCKFKVFEILTSAKNEVPNLRFFYHPNYKLQRTNESSFS